MVFTDDHPATFRRTPRGIAIVRLAQRPNRFVRRGGAEYATVRAVAATTIQKHSRRPPGATSQASAHAAAYAATVNPHASARVRRPLGRGRPGLFTRSIAMS